MHHVPRHRRATIPALVSAHAVDRAAAAHPPRCPRLPLLRPIRCCERTRARGTPGWETPAGAGTVIAGDAWRPAPPQGKAFTYDVAAPAAPDPDPSCGRGQDA